MPRRKTGNTTTGRPGFGRGISVTGGGLVSKTKAAKSGVRRLFARDPSKGAFSQFGTKRDILDFHNDPDVPNVTGGSSPRIVDGSASRRRTSGGPGMKGVRNRSANRSLKKH